MEKPNKENRAGRDMAGQKRRKARSNRTPDREKEHLDEELDEALDESFPASDPPQMTQK